MLPWDGQSLADCSSPRFRRYFLFRHFSAYCRVHAGIRPKRKMPIKDQATGVIMSQTEVTRRNDEQTAPLNDAGVGKRPRKPWLILMIALIAVATVFLGGVWSHVRAGTALKAETAQVARPAVSVVSPKQTAPAQEIILPGNVQPFITSPIYARTNGYLRKWYFDIGAHVKQGQLLAVIETPEVDQQLEQSLSNLNTAKANLALAETTKNRYQGLVKDNAVSQQDVDNAVGTYNANKAIADANQ